MVDPALAGYCGSVSLDTAAGTVADLIEAHRTKVDGINVSPLDARREVALRNRLPEGVELYTGDDFDYPELIKGDTDGFSRAPLGIFAASAPAASPALHAPDRGDITSYDEVLAPTYYYKTGTAVLARLNEHQPGFTMVGGLQSGPSLPQLAETFRLADAAGSSRRRTMPGAGRRSTTTGARSARRPARARHDRRRLDRAAAAARSACDEAGYDGPVEVESSLRSYGLDRVSRCSDKPSEGGSSTSCDHRMTV